MFLSVTNKQLKQGPRNFSKKNKNRVLFYFKIKIRTLERITEQAGAAIFARIRARGKNRTRTIFLNRTDSKRATTIGHSKDLIKF